MLDNINNLEITQLNIAEVEIKGTCKLNHKYYSVICSVDGINAWYNGAYIQNAMPELSVDQREFLISGISPEGWKEYFGEDFDE